MINKSTGQRERRRKKKSERELLSSNVFTLS